DRTVFNDEHTYRDIAVRLTTGAFRFVTGNSAKTAYKITTPLASIGVRGTILDILSQRGNTTVVLQEGASSVCTLSFQCIQLTQPGDTPVIVSTALAAAISLVLLAMQAAPAAAQAIDPDCDRPCPVQRPPPVTDGGTSGTSVNGLADQRFNQMITNRVLGTVLLGVNEQINCSDCISAFGSAGSFSAGVHGRKEITANLSLLAGIAYTQFSENGYSVTSAPIGAFALRYDFVDWGSSRPFFDVGAILTPFEKVRYSRSYTTSLGPVALTSST